MFRHTSSVLLGIELTTKFKFKISNQLTITMTEAEKENLHIKDANVVTS